MPKPKIFSEVEMVNEIDNKENKISHEYEEFLEHIIKIFFSSYKDKKIFLSIFNLDKKCLFATDRTKLEFGFLKHINETDYFVLSQNEKLKIDYYHNATKEILDMCMNSHSIVSCIVFDKLSNRHGALHIMYTPIYAPNGNVCGVLSQGYDYTRMFWGCNNFNNADFNISLLKSLTQRQRNILYLLAIGYSQKRVSDALNIKRGTVSNVCYQISIRLGFESYSVEKLLERIGRYNIIKTLDVPDINIKSMIMYFVHSKSLEYNDEIVKIIENPFDN